jgi:tRNA A-37 threonylcarbamoyl transferase component Bud32
LPRLAARLHTLLAVIACKECGADNEPTAHVCAACGGSLDNPAARALIGQSILGVYTLLEVIGKGGMSVVYKARHKMTEQLVALKILPAELAIHADIKARFIEEAKALARLEHPNIVRLYNFGEEGGRFVLAMQYVEATTFERKIFAAGRLDWREAVTVSCQVLAALEYAHARGIVHRDIKPSNVLVRADGSAMVMDFGIAKMAEGGSSRLTATGQTMGTVRYMSPEQVRGHVVDHRSDLYSVGATLYEAIVGDTPFDGATHFEIMMKHLNQAPPSARGSGAHDVPVALDAVIVRALAKDLKARYQTAGQFLEALEKVLDEAGPVEGASPAAEARAWRAHRRLEGGSEPATTEYPAVARGRLDPPDGHLTGLAKVLEPDDPQPPRARRRVPRALGLGLGVLVLAGGMAAIIATRGAAKPPADAAADPLASPLLAPGFTPAVDRRFERPGPVRVLAARADLDAERVAAAYAAARARFAVFARERAGVEIATPPLTIVVAPPRVLCAPELHDAPLPADCEASPPRFAYPPRRATLYVRDDELLDVSLVQGAAAHLCISTPALLELRCMKNFLPPFWDEVEKR